MNSLVNYFHSLNLDLYTLVQVSAVFLLGTITVACIGRFIFGRKSTLTTAVSSAIGILFIYITAIMLKNAGPDLSKLFTPLPFVSIEGDTMYFYVFKGHYSFIYAELLTMIIFAFLVNIIDEWLPDGKNLFGWIFFRCLTVFLGYFLHMIVVYLFRTYLPQGVLTYAPTVLLVLLLLLLLTGTLKIIVGTILSATVHPLIGALYAFFFANVVGKQITKAVLTTIILAALVFLLNNFGIYYISIASSALITYIPFFILLITAWYLVHNKF